MFNWSKALKSLLEHEAPSANAETHKAELDLYSEEYKSCRDLVSKNIEIMERSEVYVTGAVAATAVFCLSSKNPQTVFFSSLLPFFLTFLGLIRFVGLDATIGTINRYFEEKVEKDTKLGWTTFYRQHKSPLLMLSRWTLWGTLLVGSLGFAAYVKCVGPDILAHQACLSDASHAADCPRPPKNSS